MLRVAELKDLLMDADLISILLSYAYLNQHFQPRLVQAVLLSATGMAISCAWVADELCGRLQLA